MATLATVTGTLVKCTMVGGRAVPSRRWGLMSPIRCSCRQGLSQGVTMGLGGNAVNCAVTLCFLCQQMPVNK